MKYDKSKLRAVLEAHERWLSQRESSYGCLPEGRADLSDADLNGVDLNGVNLSGAILKNAKLEYADLNDIILIGADLTHADLKCANLERADLKYANFRYTELACANLHAANLRFTNFEDADLRYSDLSDAIIFCTRLADADLGNAKVKDAHMFNANLAYAKNVPSMPMACPDSGSFIGWKRCRPDKYDGEPTIVKLLIPEDAKRSSAIGRKCRADKAVVLEIQKPDGSKSAIDTVYSLYKPGFAYKVGETVVSDGFDENRWNECSSGIHFFINRQEAVDY